MPLTYEEYIKLSKEQLEELYKTSSEEDKKVYFDYAIKAGQAAKEKAKNVAEAKEESKPKKVKSEYELLAEKKAKELNQKYKLSKDGIIDMCSKFLNTYTSEKTLDQQGNVKVNREAFLEHYKTLYVSQLTRYLNTLMSNSWDKSITSFNEMIKDFDEMAILAIKRKKDVDVPRLGGMDKIEIQEFIENQIPCVYSTDNTFFTKNYPFKVRNNKKTMKSLKEDKIQTIVDELQKNFRESLYTIKNIDNHKVKTNTVMSAISDGYKTLKAVYDSQSWWYKNITHRKIAKIEKDTLNSIKETCKSLLLANGSKMTSQDFRYAVSDNFSKKNHVVLNANEKYEDLVSEKIFKSDELKENLNINELINQKRDKEVDINDPLIDDLDAQYVGKKDSLREDLRNK